MATDAKNFKNIDRVLEVFYSFAAVPVLLGALFKITHTAPFGQPNTWLYVGLGTEALVFFVFGVLAFSKPAIVQDQLGLIVDEGEFSKVDKKIPQKSPLIAVDDLLRQADITPESLERLSNGFKNLEANIARINQSTSTVVDTQEYAAKLKDASAAIGNMTTFYNKLSETSSHLAASAEDAKNTKEQIAALAQNLQKLNQLYGNMLNAMKV